MHLRRNEILTGLLVLATVVVLTGILILLGAPGLFKPLVTYKIYLENAAGIKLCSGFTGRPQNWAGGEMCLLLRDGRVQFLPLPNFAACQ